MTQRIFSRRQLSAALGLVTASALASLIPAQAQTSSDQPLPGQLGNQSGSSSNGSSTGMSTGTSTGSSMGNTSGMAGADTATRGSILPADRALMQELANTNLQEIALGRLALSRAGNEQVRAFAQSQIDDHSRAEAQLQQLAQVKGVQLPVQPDAASQVVAQRLGAVTGPNFDRMYTDHVSMADERALLSRIGTGAVDADLRALANTTLPAADSRLQMAENLRAATNAAGSTTGSSGTTGTGGSGTVR